MNRKYSLGIKAAAIILSVFTLAITVGCVIGVIFIGDAGLYTNSLAAVQKEHALILLENRCLNAAYHYANGGTEEAVRMYEYTNFRFRIEDTDGKVLADTYSDPSADPFLTFTEAYAAIRYTGQPEYWSVIPEIEFANASNPSLPDTLAGEMHLNVTGYIPSKLEYTDDFSLLIYWLRAGYNWRYLLPVLGLITLLTNITLYIFLLCSAGHHPGIKEAVPNVFDKIPLDVHTAGLVLLGSLYVNLFPHYDAEWSLIWGIGGALVGYLLFLHFTMSFATRVKIGTVFRGTVIWRICRLIWKILCLLGSAILTAITNLPILVCTLVLLFVGFIWNVISAVCIVNGDEAFGFFLGLVGWIAVFIGAIWLTVCLHRLKKGAEHIAAGETDHEIDTKYLMGPLRAHAITLNHIGDGLSRAVEERLKSERFRTELITNVSHDLKTPLTSIVNYIDLMKKENIENKTVLEYIDVLDRQSARLKKLTEDLVEASKASTGNLDVSPELCDLSEFLAQCVGEYEERLSQNGLTLLVRRPEYPVTIFADGRHLWRIFDNLLNNVCKYAQPGTRVYLNLEEIGGKAILIFRNTSRFELNMTGDELTERFVRGDSSRHTEGSGLGLSIARSLTELQKGTMGIFVDGDLFKVVLSFPVTDHEQ